MVDLLVSFGLGACLFEYLISIDCQVLPLIKESLAGRLFTSFLAVNELQTCEIRRRRSLLYHSGYI